MVEFRRMDSDIRTSAQGEFRLRDRTDWLGEAQERRISQLDSFGPIVYSGPEKVRWRCCSALAANTAASVRLFIPSFTSRFDT